MIQLGNLEGEEMDFVLLSRWTKIGLPRSLEFPASPKPHEDEIAAILTSTHFR